MLSSRPVHARAALLLIIFSFAYHPVYAVQCQQGYYNPGGGNTCEPCAPGTYNDQTGHSSCQTASPGWYATGPAATKQEECGPGTFSLAGASSCTSCPVGTYQDQSGSSKCTTVQPGWYSNGPGATQEIQCGKGYYSAGGAAGCTICPPGSYCNSDTNSSPTPCPPGWYAPDSGAQESCTRCPQGTFTDFYGATQCCSCCSGWYNDNTGQTHCFNCPTGGWSPPGAVNKGQCTTMGGALSTCASSNNQCPKTGGGVPSGTIERRKVPHRHMCPYGHKNCPIYGLNAHTGYIKAYECIDIENDLETCGGCVANDSPFGYRNADGGRDCSAIPNVDAVRCLGGECLVMKCSAGFVLSRDGENCEPLWTEQSSWLES
ncbi:hypothetical protein CERSUDRAFT_150331 [Gelatoporia subvermispora B]|uniref:Tyrosine-protein kinase ephrin type A/B receptor-like domain-containing protein n=1 Tax=Ceriporiopsis subvermispora (strain B) TaxID=914234 RepID=M2PSN1_CERS8|nr:hypothetical protein CERSUDRAFT_150331 [Gelatoporia subvermispora B]